MNKYDFIVIQVDAMSDPQKVQRILDEVGRDGYKVVAAAPAGASSFVILQREIEPLTGGYVRD